MESQEAYDAPCTVRKVYSTRCNILSPFLHALAHYTLTNISSGAPLAVKGLKHTRESVVQQELGVLERAKTLGQIGDACLSAAGALRSLDIFDGCDLLVDAARQADGSNGPQADIVVTVAEKKRLTSASTGVSTQAGEGSMDAKVSVRNLFGFAEKFDLNMELGQQKSSVFRLAAARPRWLGSDAMLSADISKCAISHVKHSSFVEKLLGGSCGMVIGQPDEYLGCHDFSGVVSLRDVCQLEKNTASWPILQQRGLTLKSSLMHTFSLRRLDHPIIPTDGVNLKLTTELAGLVPTPVLGDVKFFKQTLQASAYVPLLERLTLGMSVHAGLLLPLGGSRSANQGESCISDRFFLGGPGSMWGFRTRGVGPRELRHTATGEGVSPNDPKAPRDSLGGDVMAVGTATLSVALPGKLEDANVRAHVFASGGGLQSLSTLNREGSFLPSLRACIGVGVAIPTAVGKVELNLTQVLRHRPEDAVVKNGVQLGITPNV